MSGFTAIDLSKLPVPDVIEELDYESILIAMINDLVSRAPALESALELESEPVRKILEVCALRELILRQRINEAAKGVMLAYASGADLDNLGAFFEVTRLLLDPGDTEAVPPVAPLYEADNDFRRRIQLAVEGYSTAGPEGAYIYHALSAHGDVLDAKPVSPTFSQATVSQAILDQLPPNSIVLQVDDDAGLADPMPGDVAVSVLSRNGAGTAPQTLLDQVEAALSADEVRPLTDFVIVRSAQIVNYSIDATIYFLNGPDSEVVLAAAQTAIEQYVESRHLLGQDVTLSGVYAALHQPGVQRVELASPAADIVIDNRSASYCTGITLTHGGYDE
ncbi:baseplate assembly protein [Marinobacterium sedimentorum]|uniref:baseplate assembly protein n=1 Tax=Marinobacterium sedimentorum TaxID=2927804 RepID=UPI0020C6FD5E|nr:baseplate J/gp47 family protein [Marinobacterium sedimentorum]MCP8687748.1 baseplate J/gp47 family protein [Marinobacterium sedimentorum]